MNGTLTNKLQIGNIALPSEFSEALDKAKIFAEEFFGHDVVFPKNKLLSEINRYQIHYADVMYPKLEPKFVPVMLRMDFSGTDGSAELYARQIDGKKYTLIHNWHFTQD
jgi:hypothetical protein